MSPEVSEVTKSSLVIFYYQLSSSSISFITIRAVRVEYSEFLCVALIWLYDGCDHSQVTPQKIYKEQNHHPWKSHDYDKWIGKWKNEAVVSQDEGREQKVLNFHWLLENFFWVNEVKWW